MRVIVAEVRRAIAAKWRSVIVAVRRVIAAEGRRGWKKGGEESHCGGAESDCGELWQHSSVLTLTRHRRNVTYQATYNKSVIGTAVNAVSPPLHLSCPTHHQWSK